MYDKQEAEILSPDSSDTDGNGVMEVKTMDLEGYKPRVVDKINAIMPKLQAGTSLTDEEKQFIDASRIPVRYLLEMTQGNQGLQNAALDLMIDLIILDMAWSTVKTYISYVEMNIGKQSVVDGDKALDQIAQVKNGFYGELTKTMQDFETAARSYEMTEFFEKQLKKAANQAVTRSSSGKGGQQIWQEPKSLALFCLPPCYCFFPQPPWPSRPMKFTPMTPETSWPLFSTPWLPSPAAA